jgi:hypothetical protein
LNSIESTPGKKKKWTVFGGVKKGLKSLANKLIGSLQSSQRSVASLNNERKFKEDYS